MLIEFSVENFKSIRERQTISMVASNYYKELLDENTFEVDAEEKFPRLLKSAVIYGANASGKSSLVEAMACMDSMVCFSANEMQADDEVDVTPFRLSKSTKDADSEFEVSFFEEGVRYQFGFSANSERVTSEWLFAYPSGHQQKWYQREYDAESDTYKYAWSKLFQGGRRRTDWKLNTRPNALFISTAVQFNSEQLRPAYNWFRRRLATLDPSVLTDSFTLKNFDEKKEEVLSFLSHADLAIADIKINRQKIEPSDIPESVPKMLRDDFIKNMVGKEIATPRFYMESIDGDGMIEFEEEDMSAGTKALFTFAGPWLDVISNHRILFVDELDSSLHPLIVHQLIRLLHSKGSKAQVVFTTHDTTVLAQGILRRDQVWMIEKIGLNPRCSHLCLTIP
ncbi:ATP-binding protein [Pseudomonas qingdaonensis]|nr:ATP-binding protein [Pseudomonas qingdaonensis]